MSEQPTSREIAELREWFARLDTKLDFLMSGMQKAEEADRKADRANQRIDEVGRDVEQLTATLKWAVGILTTVLLGTIGFIITIVF